MPLPIVGAAFAAAKGIFKVGKGVVGKINEKRKAKGKGGLLSGLFKGKKAKAAEKAAQEQSQTEQEQVQEQAPPPPLVKPANVPDSALTQAIYAPPPPAQPFDTDGFIEKLKPVGIIVGGFLMLMMLMQFIMGMSRRN